MIIKPKNNGSGVKETIVINNRIRLELKMTMEEYAIAATIHDLREKKKPIGKQILNKETGISEDEVSSIIAKLITMGILERKMTQGANLIYATDKLKSYFNDLLEFDNESEENLGLWQIFMKHGNKQQAVMMFKRALKVVSAKELKERAIDFIASQEGKEFKHIMHCSTWLNPEFRHWEDQVQTGKNEVTQGVYAGTWKKQKIES